MNKLNRLDIRGKRGVELIEYIVTETNRDGFRLDKGSKIELLMKHPDIYFVSMLLSSTDNPEIILQYLVTEEFRGVEFGFGNGKEDMIDFIKDMLSSEVCGHIVTNNLLKACEKPDVIAETLHYIDALDGERDGLAKKLMDLIKDIAPIEYVDAISKEYHILDESFVDSDEE